MAFEQTPLTLLRSTIEELLAGWLGVRKLFGETSFTWTTSINAITEDISSSDSAISR